MLFACPATDVFFRARIDHMIDLRHPLAVLVSRMPWQEIEASVAQVFSRKGRAGVAMTDLDLFGEQVQRVAVASNAGRPHVPMRIMIALLYLKHVHGRPRFAKLSVRDDMKVKIAPVHLDFGASQARGP